MKYEELLKDFFAAAITGILSDPEDHDDWREPGETCQQAVAREAMAVAEAAVKVFQSTMDSKLEVLRSQIHNKQ